MARTRSKRKRPNPVVESDADDSDTKSIAKSGVDESIEVTEVPMTLTSQPSATPTPALQPDKLSSKPMPSQSVNDTDPHQTDSTDQSKKKRSDVWFNFKKSGLGKPPLSLCPLCHLYLYVIL
jgi:hypothetical protein